jgi:hypothetical protein
MAVHWTFSVNLALENCTQSAYFASVMPWNAIFKIETNRVRTSRLIEANVILESYVRLKLMLLLRDFTSSTYENWQFQS